MIRFSKLYPKYKYPIGFLKLLKAYYDYFDHPVIDNKNPELGGFLGLNGKQSFLSSLRDKHKGERCFIIANGPSLNKIDISLLKDEITIGCNGIYKNFSKWGFNTNYYMIVDNVQIDIRAKEIAKLKGSVKFTGLHNSYSFPFFNDMNYFHVPIRSNMEYLEKELLPPFSNDVASIMHRGPTITYLMIQMAYHLGFSKIYLIGLDHNYGKLPELFPPGKIKVTKENYHLVQECHFDKDYYKIGDTLGVPNVKAQEKAYTSAKTFIESTGREIINLSPDSKLNIFKKEDYESLLK